MGFRIMDLPNLTDVIGARRIEVAQTPISQPIGPPVRFQGIFKKQFGRSVWVYRGSNIILRNGHQIGASIDGAGGGENKSLNFRVNSRIQKSEGCLYVVFEVLAWILNRFADICVSSKVHYGAHATQHFVQYGNILDIGMHKFKSIRKTPATGGQIVIDDDGVAMSPESASCMATDVSCSSNNENGRF